VLFFLLFLLAADAWKAKKSSRALILGALALLVFALFALTWRGAAYVLAVPVAAGAVHRAIALVKKRDWTRLCLLALALAALAWLFSTTELGGVVYRYLGLIPPSAHAASIAELSGGDLFLFAIALGGWTMLAMAVITWVALARKNLRAPSFAWLVALAWFALLGFATFQAVRFVYYVLPPTALLVGVALKHLAAQARMRVRSQAAQAGVFLAVLVVVGLLTLPLLGRTQHAMQPFMHDGIIGIGQVIEQRMPQDARVISWWEYGHFWKYAAKREPYLDGRAKPEAAGARNARLWAVARSFLTDDPEEARLLWNVLRCKDRQWINGRLGDLARLGEGACEHPFPAVVIVDERMLDTAQSMADIVLAIDRSFAAGSAAVTPVEQCIRSEDALSCGTYGVDLASRRTSGGIPVWLTVNGTRSVTNASDKVAVVYESQENYFAFVTTPWFADTVLVRLLAGESLGIQPIASVDAPERIVAYRLT
jgi:asparagine N-glycosylation enzyme membrane subunit Stt3